MKLKRSAFVLSTASAGILAISGRPKVADADIIYTGPVATNPGFVQHATGMALVSMYYTYLDQTTFLGDVLRTNDTRYQTAVDETNYLGEAANSFLAEAIIPDLPVIAMSQLPQWTEAFIKIADSYNKWFSPAANLAKRRSLAGKRRSMITLDDAAIEFASEGALGEVVGILVAATVGAPILAGAAGGLLLVGLAGMVLDACYDIPPTDLQKAMASAALPGTLIGAAVDTSNAMKLASTVEGAAIYATGAAEIIGGLNYLFRHYDENLAPLRTVYGSSGPATLQNPTYIFYGTVSHGFSTKVTFNNVPQPTVPIPVVPAPAVRKPFGRVRR